MGLLEFWVEHWFSTRIFQLSIIFPSKELKDIFRVPIACTIQNPRPKDHWRYFVPRYKMAQLVHFSGGMK
ncbi:hypothetical protein BLJ79_09315 [Arthrobacter sp. UCD-GKA]|nr:hypothetical protein BLJ79_09315 [Arthrobacter sp. UCD-GKA]